MAEHLGCARSTQYAEWYEKNRKNDPKWREINKRRAKAWRAKQKRQDPNFLAKHAARMRVYYRAKQSEASA